MFSALFSDFDLLHNVNKLYIININLYCVRKGDFNPHVAELLAVLQVRV
jgi:hypothetical protein